MSNDIHNTFKVAIAEIEQKIKNLDTVRDELTETLTKLKEAHNHLMNAQSHGNDLVEDFWFNKTTNIIDKDSIQGSVLPRPQFIIELGGGRRRIAPVIKDAIGTFDLGESFNARDVFSRMNLPDDDYDRTRPSIASWLLDYSKRGELIAEGQGVYQMSENWNKK